MYISFTSIIFVEKVQLGVSYHLILQCLDEFSQLYPHVVQYLISLRDINKEHSSGLLVKFQAPVNSDSVRRSIDMSKFEAIELETETETVNRYEKVKNCTA